MTRYATPKDRLLAGCKVDEPTGCWVWQRSTHGNRAGGYGKIKANGRSVSAHRLAYELFVGPVVDGLMVLHSCDNPPCVNPGHLFLGTGVVNMRDMVAKGRNRYTIPDNRGARNGRVKLTEEMVRRIRDDEVKKSQRVIAMENGVSRSLVRKILARRIWKTLGDGGQGR